MTDTILIVGGGLAGLTAARVCADAGARAIVVDNGPIIGGRLAPMMIGDSATCEGIDIPRLGDLSQMENAEFVTLAELIHMQGRPGNFTVSIRERARFVTDDCTRCGHCRPVCPSVASNPYDLGLTYRKAIYTPLPETFPPDYVIDIDSCLNRPPNYLPCNRCIEVCDDNAIRFDLPGERVHERQVGAVIVSCGFDMSDGGELTDSGYGAHPDVVTSAELGRLLMAPGPTGGFAAKPSNEQYPDRVLWIVDELTRLSTYTAASQIRCLLDQGVGQVTLLSTTQANGSEKTLLENLPDKVTVASGLLRHVESGEDNAVSVTYANFSGTGVPRADFDLVVLDSTVRPATALAELAATLDLDLSDAGYVATPESPCVTTRPGVFVAGGATGPLTLPETVAGARAAATAALAQLDPRLLKTGYVPAPQDSPAAKPETLSVDDVRARLEQALNTLLK